jgi:rRNA maturation RNase YbeY
MVSLLNNSKTQFFFENVTPVLRNRKKLKKFLTLLFKKEGKRLSSLNFIFCTDQSLLKINRQYLNHDFYTDVISFNLSDSPDKIVADIYISLDRIKDNAKRFKKVTNVELHRVIFHGVLHLCGYSDKTSANKKLMRMKEDAYLSLYFGRFT